MPRGGFAGWVWCVLPIWDHVLLVLECGGGGGETGEFGFAAG